MMQDLHQICLLPQTHNSGPLHPQPQQPHNVNYMPALSASSSWIATPSNQMTSDMNAMSVSFPVSPIDSMSMYSSSSSGNESSYQSPPIRSSKSGPQTFDKKSKQSKKKKSSKAAYKHVPHREKPAHLVARRNARERRRVQAVNSAFAKLRKTVPLENRNKRLSKVKTLHRAIEYISALQELLSRAEEEEASSTMTSGTSMVDPPTVGHSSNGSMTSFNSSAEVMMERNLNKENVDDSKWLLQQLDPNCHHYEPCITPYYHHYHHNHLDSYSTPIH